MKRWGWLVALAVASVGVGAEAKGGSGGSGKGGGGADDATGGSTTTADATGGGSTSTTATTDPKALRPLSQVPVPQLSNPSWVDKQAAIRLGKALFWDTQVGGDGKQACASCHFNGGADVRKKNTLNPGPDGVFASGGVTGPGQMFNLANILNDDRVGSQGLRARIFKNIRTDPTRADDACVLPTTDDGFMGERAVTGRNTPSAIGAVYMRDLFWDGRANHNFNGQNPFGGTGNNSSPRFNDSENGALASQSVGPPNNGVEMSCAGRPFNGPNSLGAKLLAREILRNQVVSPTDSVLGAWSASPNPGLKCGSHKCTYAEWTAAAFGATGSPPWREQFSNVWGQSVAAYEATLIPDQTPLDKFLAGNTSALTANQQRGLDRFKGKGQCIHCHAGGELSDATVSFVAASGLINEEGGDQGFHNLGVRPTNEDLGRANTGPNGVPWSVSGSTFDRGAFKTPGLRNVKLNPPYFHNGVKATLRDVVDFYNRGGDFANPEKANRIKPLGLDTGDVDALVDFLTNGLTDCRVEKHRAPFDHPALAVPNGPSLPAVGANGFGSCP